MKNTILFMVNLLFIPIILHAHHQIGYIAIFETGIAVFMSSGHYLPVGEHFPGLAQYQQCEIIDPAGNRHKIKSAVDMDTFGFSVMPISDNGLYIFCIASEHYGCKTTRGYFAGSKLEAINAGRKVLVSKHTFRYSKSYRWQGDGNEPDLKAGHSIEIVPDYLPKHLKKGDKISVTLYFDDQPMPDMTIAYSSMKSSREITHPSETEKFLKTVITDQRGKTELEMLDAGWMLFTAEKLTENPEPDVDILYHSTVLTIWVEN